MTAPRVAHTTVRFVDEYCSFYRNLFSDVRSYEAFKYLHIGMISDLKRKSLPAIAKLVGLDNPQGLQNFFNNSPWDIKELRKRRIERLLSAVRGRKIILIIDETGDPKKGKKTDYTTRQYLGKLGKIEQGIVAVTAYGVLEGITFPILFEVFKHPKTLKEGDIDQTKTQIAARMVREIVAMGFEVKMVLADSLYGESETTFIEALEKLKLNFIVAIRSNHGVWMPKGARVRANKWRKFTRTMSEGKEEERYIREIIFGRKRRRRYWEMTTDPETLPANSTYYVMSQVPELKYHQVGNFYGCRTWVEYGLRQSKNELGWADFRMTDYVDIEKWWEMVCSAYLMVSLQNSCFKPEKVEESKSSKGREDKLLALFTSHPEWNEKEGWKNGLNNLRLILQPFLSFNAIVDWLKIFPIPQLSHEFSRLIAIINFFVGAVFDFGVSLDFHFSSA
jgi:SRSO17 transposase